MNSFNFAQNQVKKINYVNCIMVSDNESENNYSPVPDTYIFKDSVKEYIKIHDRLAEIRKDAAMLNKRKKKLTETIIAFMKTNEKEFCYLGSDGTLMMKTSKSSLALKKEQITELLEKYGNIGSEAKDIAEYLWSNKTTRERSVIKRNVTPLE